MNIESILQKSRLFKELVIDSGFKRDIDDFINSLQQGQNQNLVYMKDLSTRIISSLELFEENNLNKELEIILKDSTSFLNLNLKESLITLNENAEIDSRSFHVHFNKILTSLRNGISENEKAIDLIIDFCSKYSNPNNFDSKDEEAVISLIFKDLNSTSSIKGFTKVLNKWNTILLTYHTVLTSDSPTDIDLECIQNGSIDVVLNVNLDVALNLTEVFKYGMMTFGTYMTYKLKLKHEILDIYEDNPELKKLEEQKEKLMLNHIKGKINIKIHEQHNKHLKEDDKIDTTSIEKKIDNISSLITEHIIKGNEFKLLSEIADKKDEENEIVESSDKLKKELREATTKVIQGYKELTENDVQLLLETFQTKDDIEVPI